MARKVSSQRSPLARQLPAPPDDAPRRGAAAERSSPSEASQSAQAPGSSLTPEQLKHLDYIQGAVGRHMTHAFAVKGWSLTVTGVVFAYAASHLNPWLAAVALLPPLAFAWLDLYYLRQALLFEELYRDVIRIDPVVHVLDLDTGRYQDPRAHPRCSYRNIMRRSSWWVLHFTVVAVGLALLGVAIFQ